MYRTSLSSDVKYSQGFLSRGDGTFTSFYGYYMGSDIKGFEVADVDLDGFPDLVAIDYINIGPSDSHGAAVYQGPATFSFDGSANYEKVAESFAGDNPRIARLGDMNGDGFPTWWWVEKEGCRYSSPKPQGISGPTISIIRTATDRIWSSATSMAMGSTTLSIPS